METIINDTIDGDDFDDFAPTEEDAWFDAMAAEEADYRSFRA